MISSVKQFECIIIIMVYHHQCMCSGQGGENYQVALHMHDAMQCMHGTNREQCDYWQLYSCITKVEHQHEAS